MRSPSPRRLRSTKSNVTYTEPALTDTDGVTSASDHEEAQPPVLPPAAREEHEVTPTHRTPSPDRPTNPSRTTPTRPKRKRKATVAHHSRSRNIARYGPYAARFRLAASRHFVDIPRAPHQTVTGVKDLDAAQEDQEEVTVLRNPLSRSNYHYDRFHQDEVRLATQELRSFKALVNSLDAQGALGPGPDSGQDNVITAVANDMAVHDLLQRFPNAPPRHPPMPEPTTLASLSVEEQRTLRDETKRLTGLYRTRYATYAALYHRHALAAWPDHGTAQAQEGALGDEVTGMVDRYWRRAVQAGFQRPKRPKSSTPSSSFHATFQSDDTYSHSSSGSDPESETASHGSGSQRSTSRSSSVSASGSSRSRSRSSSPTGPQSSSRSGSQSPSTSSLSSLPSPSSDSGSGSDPDNSHQRAELQSLLETLDPSDSLTNPILASIESDLRKVYAMLPILLARRRRPGPSGHPSHGSADRMQFTSAAQWGYEGPMLDWNDMLTVLRSNGGSCASGNSVGAWPSIVPANDPRANALKRTELRLKAIYEPSPSHMEPTQGRDDGADAGAVPAVPNAQPDVQARKPMATRTPDPHFSQTADTQALRADLFSVAPFELGSKTWSDLLTDPTIPI